MRRRDKALERSGFLLVVNHPEHNLVELRTSQAVLFERPGSALVIARGLAEYRWAATTAGVGGDDAG